MRLPDFIIVGSMKSGTTSLHHWLMLSSQIAMTVEETHFFNHRSKFARGAEMYASLLPEAKPGSLIGDDTPTYSYLKDVPARIHSMLSEVKLLWILREPLARSISNYWHAVAVGKEGRSIENAFLDELSDRPVPIWNRYLHRSCYLGQVQRYLALFPREQLHFISFENFISDQADERERVTEFLGIAPISGEVPHQNATLLFARPAITRLVNSLPLPSKVAFALTRTTGYRSSKLPVLSPETAERAHAFLAEGNAGLSEITGFQLA